MKRDYSNDNAKTVKQYLYNAYNDTDRDYRDPFYYQDVPGGYGYLKTDSLYAGNDATRHVATIRDRIDTALSVLSQFYSDVDSTSSQIYSMANNILAILDEVNTSMENINNLLSGSKKDYFGKTIIPTANDIKRAGINEAKCNQLKQNYYSYIFKDSDSVAKFVDDMKALKSKGELLSPEDIVKLKVAYNWYLEHGDELSDEELRKFVDVFELLGSDDLTDEMLDGFMKNDAAVAMYIADMKVLNDELEGNLPQEDTDKLAKIYHWYGDQRFGPNHTDNIDSFSDQALQNGIDAFELLCPEAKAATDDFFKIALDDPDPIVQKNIARIKFGIYTAPPEYRDVLIYYLPQITLVCYDGTLSVNDMYELSIDIVYIDLTKDYSGTSTPFGSFFHEIGHGIDDLSVEDKFLNSSEDYYISIKDDFKKSLNEQLDKYDLSDEEKEQLREYIMSPTSYNVVLDPEGPPKYFYDLPENWSYKQVIAYQKIREYYGYREFYIKDGQVECRIVKDGDLSFGTNTTGTLNGDMFGAVTNNKMGLAPTGHWPAYLNAVLPFDDTTEGNEALVSLELLLFPYWEINKLYGMEFFAEAFKYGAQNIDTTASKEVFDGTYEIFEKKMQEIYDGVPHYDI